VTEYLHQTPAPTAADGWLLYEAASLRRAGRIFNQLGDDGFRKPEG
jgi:hypothetical protein